MPNVKLPDGKTVKLPDGLTESQVAQLLINKLPDDYKDFKNRLHSKFKIDKENTGIGSTIGGIGGGLGGALAGAATGAALGSVVPIIGTTIGGIAGGIIGGFGGGYAGGAGGDIAEQGLYSNYDDDINYAQANRAGLTEGAWGSLGGFGGLLGRGGRAGAKIAKEAGVKSLNAAPVIKRAGRDVLNTATHLPIVGKVASGSEKAIKSAVDLPDKVKTLAIDKAFKHFKVKPEVFTRNNKLILGSGEFNEKALSSALKSSDPKIVSNAKRTLERFVTKAGDELVQAITSGKGIKSVSDVVPTIGKNGKTIRGFTPDVAGKVPSREVINAFKKDYYDDLYKQLIAGNIKTTGLAANAAGSLSDIDVSNLNSGGKALSNKIGLLRGEGYPQDQAVAIAHSYKKRGMLK